MYTLQETCMKDSNKYLLASDEFLRTSKLSLPRKKS